MCMSVVSYTPVALILVDLDIVRDERGGTDPFHGNLGSFPRTGVTL
jgi:hypothetical protein